MNFILLLVEPALRLGLYGENACKLAIGGSRSSLSLASLDHQSTSILKLEQP
jgi:hypothetical protein